MVSLTDLFIRNLTPPECGQITYADDTLPGFGVRVSQGGTKTFVLMYGRQRKRLTLGRYPIISLSQARSKAKILLAEVTLGDGLPPSISFVDAQNAFLERCRRKNRPRTYKDYKRILERHFRFGREPLKNFTRLEITKRLDGIATRHAEQNYAFRVVRHFCRLCVQQGYLKHNVCAEMQAPSKLTARTRILSDQELRCIWRACDETSGLYKTNEDGRTGCKTSQLVSRCEHAIQIPKCFATITKLLILTGQRRGEIAALRGEFIKGHLCVLPPTLTKNGREHTLPLGTLTTDILLNAISAQPPAAYVFPARGKPNVPFSGWSKAKTALDQLAGVYNWTLHDLRRTHRTIHARIGTPPHVAERLLNHVTSQSPLERIYNRHQYLAEMTGAVERYEQYLLKCIVSQHATSSNTFKFDQSQTIG
jgi:integrase